MRQYIRLLILPIMLPLLWGCASYYMVRDPETGNRYFTTEVERTGDAGTVKFRDNATGSVVTIQQSEVRKISRDEYEEAVGDRD